ncbi:AglZ/HisF2 family acetamidino modification protein [Bdellovibrio sp. BCCA]|uniref:AglZ/HisF2 family acetamidino modification protein n=1 Tax=Bdellovibrio sp. BCCA TaxID=3136281 RepID=UPI0030F0377D
MYRNRVIPVLLIDNGSLVKTKQFKDAVYVGDPVNAVRIFNEKEVDELTIFDISATRENREPDYSLIEEIAGECFMPVNYGGGLSNLNQIRRVFDCGVEKITINSAARNLDVVSSAAAVFGSQSIVVSIDCKKKVFLGGYSCYGSSGSVDLKISPENLARETEQAGAGEIIVSAIENDGVMKGYDLKLIKEVSSAVSIPVVAVGGAGELFHFSEALRVGASAVAAGSMFVFHGKHRAVLISYPSSDDLSALNSKVSQ